MARIALILLLLALPLMAQETMLIHPNSAKLAEVQAAIAAQGAGWTAAMPPHDVALPATPDPELMRHLSDPSVVNPAKGPTDNPPRWSWRHNNGQDWTLPVRDQGAVGTCWSFGTTGAIEGTIRVVAGVPDLPVDLSEEDLVACSGAGGTGGGWHMNAANWVHTHGVALESCFPYLDIEGVPCSDKCETWEESATHIDLARWAMGVDSIKAAITRGPVGAAFVVYEDFSYYTSGVYRRTTDVVSSSHVITIVGYDDSLGAWECRNSWGPSWGEGGYFWIAYGQCLIELQVLAVNVSVFPPYGYPALITPMSSEAFSAMPITFTWDTLFNSTGYDFELWCHFSDPGPVLRVENLPEPRYELNTMPSYRVPLRYWRVRSRNAQGCSDWSTLDRFRWTGAAVDEDPLLSAEMTLRSPDGTVLSRLGNTSGAWTLQVSDLLGRSLSRFEGDRPAMVLTLPRLAPGVYPVRYADANGEQLLRVVVR